MVISSSPLFGKCALFPREYDIKANLILGTKTSPLSFYYCSTARDSESLYREEGKMFKNIRLEKKKTNHDE